MGLMLGVLNAMGEVAVVGRRGKQRAVGPRRALVPRDRAVPWAEAKRQIEEKRFRRWASSFSAGGCSPTRRRRRPGAGRARHVPLAFDRLVADRNRALALWGFFYRLEMYVRRRSASTATTSCRSCAVTASSGGSSRSTTARRA